MKYLGTKGDDESPKLSLFPHVFFSSILAIPRIDPLLDFISRPASRSLSLSLLVGPILSFPAKELDYLQFTSLMDLRPSERAEV